MTGNTIRYIEIRYAMAGMEIPSDLSDIVQDVTMDTQQSKAKKEGES